MSLRSLFIIIFSALQVWTYAQDLGYHFIEGWTSSTTYQVDDSLLTVSLKNVVPGSEGAGRHRILLTKSTKDWTETREKVFRYDSSYVTTHFHASSIDNGSLIVTGSALPSLGIDTQLGFIAKFSSNDELITKRSFSFGVVNQPYSLIHTFEGNIALVGSYRTGTQKLRMFYLLVDSNLNTLDSNTYGCNEFNGNNGCNLSAYRIVQTNDSSYIISASAYSTDHRVMRYPIVYKVDRQGNLLWSYNAKETTYCYDFPVVYQLSNGNIMLVSVNNYFYPYKNPEYPSNRLPTINLNGSTYVTQIDSDGQFISIRDLRSDVQKFYSDTFGYNYLFSERVISTKDKGFAICGNSYVENEVGDEAGFLIKLDSLGEVSWFRRYQVDSSASTSTQFQKTYIYGISQSNNGSFLMSGRYISPPSTEYPFGYNTALSIITDEFGCIEPGCQKLNDVKEFESHRLLLVPNPSSGDFSIKGGSINNIESVDILTMSGHVISHFETLGEEQINVSTTLGQGMYFVSIQKSNGEVEVLKLVISK